MPSNSHTYNFQRGLTAADHERYISDALAAVSTSVSFTEADILYILPTRAAREIAFSPTAVFPVYAGDGTRIDNTVTFGQDLYDYWGYKVVNHETGHAMGLPDLYPFGGETTQLVGGFNLMGLISGQSPDYFAYHKWQLGWLEDRQVGCVSKRGTTYWTVSPVEKGSKGSGTRLLMIPTNDTFSILVEVRSRKGVDENACGTGVLIYTSDTSIASGYGPIKVIDSKPGSGGCDPWRGGELNDAPFGVGMVYEDKKLGIKIKITAMKGEVFLIQVDRA
jgi:M6 family metalloprotease-like protein